jgi:hypothetical protein
MKVMMMMIEEADSFLSFVIISPKRVSLSLEHSLTHGSRAGVVVIVMFRG